MREDCWYKDVCTETCADSCIRYMEMKSLVDNSNIPLKKSYPKVLSAGVDYDAFVQLAYIKDNIKDFVSDGGQLYICSQETGNGKTSWAIKLLMKYFDEIWAGNGFNLRGYFQHVPTLFNELKNFEKNHDALKFALKNADIVVWDDIASTKLSDYDTQQLLTFIDSRTLEEKANIYTGNITSKQQLVNAVGSRLASRIWSGQVVEFIGKDRRNVR